MKKKEVLRTEYMAHFHIGSFKPKELKDEVRIRSRAFLFYSRRLLSTHSKIVRSQARTTLEGHGLSLSTSHNGWVHFDLEIKPVSASKVMNANQIVNSFASFMNPVLNRKTKVSGNFIFMQEFPLNKIELARFFDAERLGRVSDSVGFKLRPEGMWLTAKDGRIIRSVVVTGYRSKYSVGSQFYTPIGDQIPINILIKNFKSVRETLLKALPALRVI